MTTFPERLFSVPVLMVLKAMFDSSAPPPVPELLIAPLVKVKLTTLVPRTPLLAVLLMLISLNDGEVVLVRRMPSLAMFWIVPPEPAVPVPVTVRAPAPVLFNTMPLAAPFAEMLRKLSPGAAIGVFTTFSAKPVVVASVLLEPVTAIAPLLPDALKAPFAPVLMASEPVNDSVEAAPVMEMP